jgi:hypothetical protein
MQIEDVDMSVPVGQPGRATPDDLEAEVSATVQALQERCITVVRQRSRWAFTRRSRVASQQQFTLELKGLIKKLASTACSDIRDRDAKATMRIRLYGDLSAVAQALCDEMEAISRRRRLQQSWLLGILLVVALGTGYTSGLITSGL